MSSRSRTAKNFRSAWVRWVSGRESIIPFPFTCKRLTRTLATTRVISRKSEKAAAQILSLPMFPGLTYAQQDRIAQHVLDFVDVEANVGVSVASRTVSLNSQGR